MEYSADQFLTQLQALLPIGRAWPRESGAQMTQLLAAMAEEYARADGRGIDLLTELDPRTTVEMIGDWETLLGLPDACTPIADTLEDRRLAVIQRLVSLGGQSRAFFVDLADRLGYLAEVEEHAEAQIGDHIGDRLNGVAWAFAWTLRTLPPIADDPFGLQCQVRRGKPAHTEVLFEDVPIWFDFLEL